MYYKKKTTNLKMVFDNQNINPIFFYIYLFIKRYTGCGLVITYDVIIELDDLMNDFDININNSYVYWLWIWSGLNNLIDSSSMFLFSFGIV